MKKFIDYFETFWIIVFGLFSLALFIPACGDKPLPDENGMKMGLTTQSVQKARRDTVKGVIADHYQRSVTVSWDSVVIIGIAATTPPPVDTVVVPPPTPPAGYTVTYTNGFDSKADLDPDDHGQIGNGSLSTTIFKTGPGSFHSVPANVSSGIRSEVQFDDNRTSTDGAVEWDAYYVRVQSDNIHTAQFHPNTSGGSASPGLWTISGKFALVNWKGGTNTKYSTNYTIPVSKWIHIRIEYKFGSSGYLRLIVDGVTLIDRSGIQVGDGSGQYFKLGSNSWSGTGSDIYYDNLVISKK